MRINGQRTGIIALTKHGAVVGRRILDFLEGEVVLFLPRRTWRDVSDPRIHLFEDELSRLVAELFEGAYCGLIFIMAAGIVVRVISPWIKDKRVDPGVVVVDERGQFVISLLSGHLGGANELAEKVARGIGAMPVITTATDVWGKPAVDLLAKRYGMAIEHFEDLKHINAAIVNDENVEILVDTGLQFSSEWKGWSTYRYIDRGVLSCSTLDVVFREESPGTDAPRVIITNRLLAGSPETPYVILRPRNVIAGVGCRRGVKGEAVISAVLQALKKAGRSSLSIKHLATVDIKKDEPGIKEAASYLNVPLRIVCRAEILQCEEYFTFSEFVKEKIGVGSVCEPSAVLSGHRAELILPKTTIGKVTVALAEERSRWWESGPETSPT